MNPRRLVLALVVALLLSGAVTFFINRKLGSRTMGPQTQKYVAAAHPIQSGEVLKAESLVMIDWPITIPLQGAFTKVEDAVGRSAIYPVTSGQPILSMQLAALGSGIGLTVKIPEGMRAVSVRSDEVVGVAGFLFPGSGVDPTNIASPSHAAPRSKAKEPYVVETIMGDKHGTTQFE